MTTAIATRNEISFPALVPNSRASRIMQANLDGEPVRETDLIRVKTPSGGGTIWQIDNNGNVETRDELVGLCVGYAKRGYLWGSVEPTDERPVIYSPDLVTGYRTNDKLGDIDPAVLEQYRIGDKRYDWVGLSDANGPFGYGRGKGNGKRVKESRVVALLPDGEVWPILVSVGPGSLVEFGGFMKRLPGFVWEAVLGLKLAREKTADGTPFSRIIPRLVGTVSEEQGEVARVLYYEPLKVMFSAPPAMLSD